MSRLRESRHLVDVAYSLGLIIGTRKSNRVLDSIFLGPAYQAGIVPGMNIVAVNGRKFTPEVLHDALKAARSSSEPMQLLVENDDYFKTFSINYHEGDKYPHLERDSSKPDLLSDIIRAKSSRQ
jgi:predicted metalloprotease with PDZ domain